MLLETICLEHLPSSHEVYVTLFREVQNAAFLREHLLSRNTDFEYALVDATVIFTRQQLLAAVFKAMTAAVAGTLKTPNVHSEIVFSLSNSNNIADAYRRFGISPSTKDLIVVKVVSLTDAESPSSAKEKVLKHLQANIHGEPQLLSDGALSGLSDLPKIRKYYKLNGIQWLDALKDEQAKRKETEMLVLSAMALRGV